jgi:hypothetical protein
MPGGYEPTRRAAAICGEHEATIVIGDLEVLSATDRLGILTSSSCAELRGILCLSDVWAGVDSNHRATDYESAALTAELPARYLRDED